MRHISGSSVRVLTVGGSRQSATQEVMAVQAMERLHERLYRRGDKIRFEVARVDHSSLECSYHMIVVEASVEEQLGEVLVTRTVSTCFNSKMKYAPCADSSLVEVVETRGEIRVSYSTWDEAFTAFIERAEKLLS